MICNFMLIYRIMIKCKITATESGDLCKYNTGLGNVLFELSSTYGIAKKLGMKHNFYELNFLIEKLRSFNLDHEHTIYRNVIDNTVMDNIIHIKEERKKDSRYNHDLIETCRKNIDSNIRLDGYFQSYLYFDDSRSEIIKMFEPTNEFLQKIRNKYPEINNGKINVSLHVRQKWGAKVGYKKTYFIDAINYLSQKLNTDQFNIFIFSDDINWCKKTFDDLSNAIYCEDNYDYEDLWLMSICDHNILSHSTLSWWGAYLNKNPNKIIVYSDKLLGKFFKGLSYNKNLDCYLPDWHSIKSDTFS